MYQNYLLNPASNVLLNSINIKIAGYYERTFDHVIERWGEDRCEEFIYLLCIEGEGWVEDVDNRYKVRRNTVILIDADTPHAYGSTTDNPWSILWCHVEGELVRKLSGSMGLQKTLKTMELSEEMFKNHVQWMQRLIFRASSPMDEQGILAAHSYIQLILSELASISSDNDYIYNEVAFIEQAIEIMKSKIYSQISLEEVCDAIHVSKYYFCRAFKKATGFTPIAYFNKLKVMKACDLFVESDHRVQTVSELLNFSTPFYFSETFKKYTGYSPKAYKKAMRREH